MGLTPSLGGFTRVAAGRRQDEDIPVFFFLLLGRRQQVREQRQGQVLEGQRPAVEQFGNGQIRIDGMERYDAVIAESRIIVGRSDHLLSFFRREIRKEMGQDGFGDVLIGFAGQVFIRQDIFRE